MTFGCGMGDGSCMAVYKQPTYVQLISATLCCAPIFCTARNIKAGQWPGNEVIFTHHAHTGFCSCHLCCLHFVPFTFVKNASTVGLLL